MVWPAISSPPFVKSQAVALHYNKISTELIIAMDLFAKRLIGPSLARECDVMTESRAKPNP